MAASRLSIYNDALLIAGERALASLTENREPRYLLDQVWNNDGVLACLEEGQWFFAMRTIQIDYDPDFGQPFGFNRAFDKPDDWVLTSAVCSDEFFRVPVTRYSDESGYWYADVDTLYIKYVSSDPDYGLDLGKWPRSFAEFVAAHFASKVVLKITNDEQRLQKAMAMRQKTLDMAKNKCAMAEPTAFPAQGSWSRSRTRWMGRNDGGNGNNGNLIG
jgi:hypothetical protein